MPEVETLQPEQLKRVAIDNNAAGDNSAPGATGLAVSVILPVFNEQGIIDWVFNSVKEFSLAHQDYEFIFVDDGSVDDTAKFIIRSINELELINIRIVQMNENSGKGAAMKRGFESSNGKVILFTDGDLAYSLDYLPKLAKELKKNDIVIGSRRMGGGAGGRKSLLRLILGEGFNKCMRLIMRLPYKDTQAGLKGFSRKAASKLFSRTRISRYSTDVELLYLARKFDLKVAQLPAHVDEKHISTQSSMNLFKDPPRMFFDMLKIRFYSIIGKYK